MSLSAKEHSIIVFLCLSIEKVKNDIFKMNDLIKLSFLDTKGYKRSDLYIQTINRFSLAKTPSEFLEIARQIRKDIR